MKRKTIWALILTIAVSVFFCLVGVACGGYNLQWAWSSGYVAGINAVREN